jgi:hypothetical protein
MKPESIIRVRILLGDPDPSTLPDDLITDALNLNAGDIDWTVQYLRRLMQIDDNSL